MNVACLLSLTIPNAFTDSLDMGHVISAAFSGRTPELQQWSPPKPAWTERGPWLLGGFAQRFWGAFRSESLARETHPTPVVHRPPSCLIVIAYCRTGTRQKFLWWAASRQWNFVAAPFTRSPVVRQFFAPTTYRRTLDARGPN